MVIEMTEEDKQYLTEPTWSILAFRLSGIC